MELTIELLSLFKILLRVILKRSNTKSDCQNQLMILKMPIHKTNAEKSSFS